MEVFRKKLRLNKLEKKLINGAPARIRTADLLITNQLLYQLSYKGTNVFYYDFKDYQVLFLC